MRGQAHSDETKAAVMAALLAGQGVNQIAKQMELPERAIYRIKAGMGDKLAEVGIQKTRDFGEMLGNYLETLLTTAIIQQEHFRDKAWLNRQSAENVAVLHGVSIDKGIRLFEAATRSRESTAPVS